MASDIGLGHCFEAEFSKMWRGRSQICLQRLQLFMELIRSQAKCNFLTCYDFKSGRNQVNCLNSFFTFKKNQMYIITNKWCLHQNVSHNRFWEKCVNNCQRFANHSLTPLYEYKLAILTYYRWKSTIKTSLDIYEFCFLNSYKLYLIKLIQRFFFFKSPFKKKIFSGWKMTAS